MSQPEGGNPIGNMPGRGQIVMEGKKKQETPLKAHQKTPNTHTHTHTHTHKKKKKKKKKRATEFDVIQLSFK